MSIYFALFICILNIDVHSCCGKVNADYRTIMILATLSVVNSLKYLSSGQGCLHQASSYQNPAIFKKLF